MTATDIPGNLPTCYFCDEEFLMPYGYDTLERRRVRKSDGSVSDELVCANCDPRR